jgi:hypothetical protein
VAHCWLSPHHKKMRQQDPNFIYQSIASWLTIYNRQIFDGCGCIHSGVVQQDLLHKWLINFKNVVMWLKSKTHCPSIYIINVHTLLQALAWKDSSKVT